MKKWVSTNFSISKGIFEEIIWGNKNFWRQFDLVRYCDAWTDARSWLLARAESRRQGRLHHHQLGQHPGRDGVQLPEIRPQVRILMRSDDELKGSQSQEDRSPRGGLRHLFSDALWGVCFCQGEENWKYFIFLCVGGVCSLTSQPSRARNVLLWYFRTAGGPL